MSAPKFAIVSIERADGRTEHRHAGAPPPRQYDLRDLEACLPVDTPLSALDVGARTKVRHVESVYVVERVS